MAINLEDKINQYIDVLRKLQAYFLDMNNGLANRWKKELSPEDEKKEFVGIRIAEEYLCPADFMTWRLCSGFSEAN
ncbi:MAG: hypothetical protein N2691_05940 [Patescibacteria group bacterium]|nr:hypothetical protein [Patescibacteria group bacterium]